MYLCPKKGNLIFIDVYIFDIAGPPDPPQNCDVHNHTTQGTIHILRKHL